MLSPSLTFLAIIVLAACLATASCTPSQPRTQDAGTETASAPAKAGNLQVLIACRDSNEVIDVAIDPQTGKASIRSQAACPGGAHTLCVDERRGLVYAAGGNKTEAGFQAITLETDGRLGAVHASAMPHVSAYLILDAHARHLLSTSYAHGITDIFALDEQGHIGEPVQSVDEDINTAHSLLLSDDQRFAYVSYVKEVNRIHQYRYDAQAGQLAPLVPPVVIDTALRGPRHPLKDPRLPFYYYSDEQGPGISSYHADPEYGRLRLLARYPAFTDADAPESLRAGKKINASDIAMSADARWMFVAVRDFDGDDDAIVTYAVQDDGHLERRHITPSEDIPWAMSCDPAGPSLFVVTSRAQSLQHFAIQPDGSLVLEQRLDLSGRGFDCLARRAPSHGK